MNSLRKHNKFTYRLEWLVIRFRDLLRPPSRVLVAAGVRNGMTVLDFGCGPGGFSLAVAQLVGAGGWVYALDIQPLAIKSVRQRAARCGFENVRPISRPEEVCSESVDMVLLYDVFHIHPGADWRTAVMATIHHVLKPKGILSIRDHHLREVDWAPWVVGSNLFRFRWRSRWSSQYERIEGCKVTL